jgi:protein O-mannosyl-transferase
MSQCVAQSPEATPLSGFARFTSRRPFWLATLLAALTLAVYLQVGSFGFVPIDDNLYVTADAHLRGGLSAQNIAWAFTSIYDCNWIPLTWLSLMLDATLFGASPGGHHLTNVAFHVLNVLLVFALFARATKSIGRSAFVAAMFAVHPLHVESVAWIAERKDVLSLLFGLAALNCYVTYATEQRTIWRRVALTLYTCSLLSKQTLVTLPFVLLLLDYWPLGRFSSARDPGRLRGLVAEKFPFFAVSAIFCAIELLAQVWGHSTRSLVELPIAIRLLNVILVYALYLKKAILPFGLAAFYPHPGVALNLTKVGAAFILLALITGYAIASARRRPFVLVGWLWYLGTLVPMLGIVQVGIQQMADRYTYFPMLGIYAAAAWLLPALLTERVRRWEPVRWRVLPTAAAGIVAAYAILGFNQVGHWRDGVTLMRHTLALTPDNSFARFLLGDALADQGQSEEALVEYQHAVRLAPSDPEAYFRLGYVYQGRKEYDLAAEQYRTSLDLDERIATTHNRLGWVLWAKHQDADAKQEFLRALELDPTNVEANAHLAGVARGQADFTLSIDYCRQALKLDPGLIDYERLIAFNLRDLGRLDEAIAQLEAVLAVAPEDAEARTELAHVRQMRGDAPDVVGQLPNAEALRTQGN